MKRWCLQHGRVCDTFMTCSYYIYRLHTKKIASGWSGGEWEGMNLNSKHFTFILMYLFLTLFVSRECSTGTQM